jgi:hypothetical protein
MKKLILIALAVVLMVEVPAHAQMDWLGSHLEAQRAHNLRKHQQKLRSGKQKPRKRKVVKNNSTRNKRSSLSAKEANLPASRLRIGDVIHAIHSGKNNIVFKGRTAKVASRTPLVLNLTGTASKPRRNGEKVPFGNFAIVTSTGRRSGVIGVMTLNNPGSAKFTRFSN